MFPELDHLFCPKTLIQNAFPIFPFTKLSPLAEQINDTWHNFKSGPVRNPPPPQPSPFLSQNKSEKLVFTLQITWNYWRQHFPKPTQKIPDHSEWRSGFLVEIPIDPSVLITDVRDNVWTRTNFIQGCPAFHVVVCLYNYIEYKKKVSRPAGPNAMCKINKTLSCPSLEFLFLSIDWGLL